MSGIRHRHEWCDVNEKQGGRDRDNPVKVVIALNRRGILF